MSLPVHLVDSLAGTAPGSVVEVTGDEAHHAVAVRRIAVGEELVLTDGAGAWARCEVAATGKQRLVDTGGLDPDEYQGFAWGMGLDRIAMLKYGMPDLRDFFNADVRWMNHYGFRPLDMPTLFGGLSA